MSKWEKSISGQIKRPISEAELGAAVYETIRTEPSIDRQKLKRNRRKAMAAARKDEYPK